MLEAGNDTHCPHCGALVVRRRGYDTHVEGLLNNACASCHRILNFIYKGTS